MKLVKKINVELNRKGFPKEIDVVQYDTGLQLKCIVKDFDIPNGTTATLYAEKPSGKFVYQQTGIEISDNTIIVDLENQVITEHGKVWMQITLSNGTDTISTFEMLMKVQKSRKDSGAVESTTVIRAFDEAIEKAVAQINEARDAASKYISESVDQSLSIAGKAADAAAVGKKVTELNEKLVQETGKLSQEIANQQVDIEKLNGVVFVPANIKTTCSFTSPEERTASGNIFRGFRTRFATPNADIITALKVTFIATEDCNAKISIISDDKSVVYWSQDNISVVGSDILQSVTINDLRLEIEEENCYLELLLDNKVLNDSCCLRQHNVNTSFITSQNMTGEHKNQYAINGNTFFDITSSSSDYGYVLNFELSHADLIKSTDKGEMNYVYVNKNGSDENGNGSKEKPYSTIWHANQSITDNSKEKPYTIIVGKGTYDDISIACGGIQPTDVGWGLNLKNYVFIESENPKNPSDYIINFDGAYGLSDDEKIKANIIYKSPINVFKDGYNNKNELVTGIRGFYIKGKNCRYAFHTETSLYGDSLNWYVKDCIIEYLGRPDIKDNDTNGAVIGWGLSPLTEGVVENCNLIHSDTLIEGNKNGIYVHNNGRSVTYLTNPSYVWGGRMTLKNVNFNNTILRTETTETPNNEGYNIIKLDNVCNCIVQNDGADTFVIEA